ncbi:P-II family nitrogen regulator [Wolinella succinogenes]|uniref:P-II family nitrogen regulator n=1 Tax=Wolinella succinogenes TaxID=844 RepID=UPI00240A2135|nr:hypothetical protein [Wolinella succinogenes]
MKFVALIVITSGEHEESLKTIAKNAGARGATILQARGSGSEEKRSFFSLTFEGNQSLILYILEEKLSKTILKTIHKATQNKAIECVAFTVPLAHIVGLDQTLLRKFEDSIKQESDL